MRPTSRWWWRFEVQDDGFRWLYYLAVLVNAQVIVSGAGPYALARFGWVPAASALSLQWPWLWLPGVGPIRVSTIVTALVIAALVTWRRRSPATALIAVMAWASAYEVGFVTLGTFLHGWSGAYLVWLIAALAGWIVLAQVWGVVPDRWLALATAVLTLAWIATGFEANSASLAGPGYAKAFSLLDEVFNEGTKTLLGLAYLAGALHARRRP